MEKAFEAGCERVVVILSKPKDTIRTPEKDSLVAQLIQRQYPPAANSLRRRAERCNDGVKRAKEAEPHDRRSREAKTAEKVREVLQASG